MRHPCRRITDRLPWRVLPILAYVALAIAAAYSVGKVKTSLDKIEEVEARAFAAICQRQREGLTRLRETKSILVSTNRTLVDLLGAIEPATETNRTRLLEARRKLAVDVARLQEGMRELDVVIPSSCPRK